MRTTLLVPVLLLVACTDYRLHGQNGQNGTPTDDTDAGATGDGTHDDVCDAGTVDPEEVGVTDLCEFSIGDFHPKIEWSYGKGKSSRATVAVGDLDHDGLPEIVANVTDGYNVGETGGGKLVVLKSDGSVLWSVDAKLGFGSPAALGDLDGDGWPEIVAVREYKSSMMAKGDYTAVCYDHLGNLLWESEHFVGLDFDYGTAPIISDMDHDGSPEVVLGRVILDADGKTVGHGEYGRGSYGVSSFGGMTISEATVPAVVDIDLDGEEEVIVGDAVYAKDGTAKWHDKSQDDGMVAIANLDDDPEGERILSTHDTVRAVDTDGTVIWGPKKIPSANIVSPAAIDDLDGDGKPEIVVAGGNNLYVLKRNGNILWQASVSDSTGASGASIFDFEGDGIPEVVYIDEVEMIAFDGATGKVKFQTSDHASDTLFDYPVIADVDGDGHAEIVVAHAGWDYALSVYGDKNDSWAPARKVWNQHAYSIENVNDDLSIPQDAVPAFTTNNSWHSQLPGDGALTDDLEGDIVDVCLDDCDNGHVLVVGRVRNRSERELPAGVPVALYARKGTEKTWLATVTTTSKTKSGWTSEALDFTVDADDVRGADALVLVADDTGTGGGIVTECSEDNNAVEYAGPFCR